ncbi:MAG: DUF349 domain-containing protein [Vicinamibacteria bacterium]
MEDQTSLERLAAHDPDPRVRQVAVRRLKSSRLVLGVLGTDADLHVRQEAQDRLFKALLSSEAEASSLFAETAPHLSDDELVRIAKEVHGDTSAKAVTFVKGAKALADLAKTARSHDVRLAAFARVKDSDEAMLADIALHSEFKDSGLAAVEKISSEAALTRVAERARLKPVAREALSRLGREESQPEMSNPLEELHETEVQDVEEAPVAPIDPAEEARLLADFDAAVQVREALLAKVEALPIADVRAAVVEAKLEWVALPPLSGVQGHEFAERFSTLCSRKIAAAGRAERFAAISPTLDSLATRAETLAGEEVIRNQRERVRALRAEWDQSTKDAGVADDDARRLRFETAVLKVEQGLAEIDAASQQKRDEELELLRTLPTRLGFLIQQQDVAVSQLEEAQRELRTMEPLVGMLQGDERKKIGKALEDVRPKLFAKTQEVREAVEWTGFAHLAAQERLIAEIEAASGIENPDSAANKLRDIEARWAEVRKVPKDQGEELWKKFTSFRDPLRKRLNEFFSKRTVEQKDSKKKKEELIARAEAMVAAISDSTDWKKGAEDFKTLQNEWRTFPSSGKHEKDLIPRFKAPADRFFAARKTAMEQRDKTFGANREAFESLVKRAEALALSTEWDKTTNEAKKLQAEWKSIGTIPMREREKLYGRFHKSVDAVFDRYRRRDSIEDEKFQAERAAFLAEMEALVRLNEGPAVDPAAPDGAAPVEVTAPVEGEAVQSEGPDYKAKVQDFRARWRKMSGRPSREQDVQYKTLFASLISKNTEAFKGTDLDVEENKKKLEKLVVKLEALEGDKTKADSMDLATKLKEAWASRTMGVKPGGSSFRAEVEKARSIYEKIGPIVGDDGEAVRKRFEAICRKLS